MDCAPFDIFLLISQGKINDAEKLLVNMKFKKIDEPAISALYALLAESYFGMFRRSWNMEYCEIGNRYLVCSRMVSVIPMSALVGLMHNLQMTERSSVNLQELGCFLGGDDVIELNGISKDIDVLLDRCINKFYD